MVSALLEELKAVATEVKRGQIEDAVGSLWAAPAAEKDPQGRRDRESTSRSGSRRRRGARGETGGRGG